MPEPPEVITPDLVSRTDVINNLLAVNLNPSFIAQILRIDISEVYKHSGFTEIQDKELAQGVATLFNKALVRANFDLDFAHPEQQASLLHLLLSGATRRYSGTENDQASEMRVTLERLLLSETAPHAPLPQPGPQVGDLDDQNEAGGTETA